MMVTVLSVIMSIVVVVLIVVEVCMSCVCVVMASMGLRVGMEGCAGEFVG